MEGKDKKNSVNIVIVIVAIIIITFVGGTVLLRILNLTNNNYEQETSSYNDESDSNTKNPYKVTDKYDGVYKFTLDSDNGEGHIFTSIGAISFNNGICKAKYLVSSDTLSEYTREYEGFCGINENNNQKFYFTLNNNGILYECSTSDKNLSCKLKSVYDLSGCTSEELVLTYVEDSKNIDEVFADVIREENEKKEAEEKAKKEAEEQSFKESCKTYTFEQMARNPDNFKGTNVKITGEVVQALYGSNSVDLRINITKKGTYSTYYTDTIYVVYYPQTGEDKILEDDIVTIYGTSQGDYSYTSTIGTQVTLPLISAKYIELEK